MSSADDDLRRIKRAFDEADAGVAFRAAHGISRDEWIEREIAAGASPASARDTCRKMAAAALVPHRLREQAQADALGRAYNIASRPNDDT